MPLRQPNRAHAAHPEAPNTLRLETDADITQGQIILQNAHQQIPQAGQAAEFHALAKAIAGQTADPRTVELAAKYRAGGFGYGHAKQALFELLLDHFGPARQRRAALMADPAYVDGVLRAGAGKARALARATVDRARAAVGL